MCRLESWHVNAYYLLPSQLSSGFWPCPLSPGLDISALVCLDFAFHLLSFVISFSWPHLYRAFAHVQTISTSTLCGILPVPACLQMSTFLTLSRPAFHLAHHNMRISVVCNFLYSLHDNAMILVIIICFSIATTRNCISGWFTMTILKSNSYRN